MEIDNTEFLRTAARAGFMTTNELRRAYGIRPTTSAHVPPRPMPAPAPQPRPLASRCAGCGAPLNLTALCNYCKSPNPWTSR